MAGNKRALAILQLISMTVAWSHRIVLAAEASECWARWLRNMMAAVQNSQTAVSTKGKIARGGQVIRIAAAMVAVIQAAAKHFQKEAFSG